MKKYWLLVLALGFAPNVMAGTGPSFNFVEGALHHYTADGSSSSNNGWGLKGSFDLGSQLFVQGEYNSFDSDIDWVYLGLGYRFPMSHTADLYVRADVAHASALKVSDTSWQVALGARAMVAPSVELEGEIAHDKLFDTGSTTFSVAGYYGFTNELSAGLGYATQSDSNLNRWMFSARFKF